MEIYKDSMADIFLFLTIVVWMRGPILNRSTEKRRAAFTSAVTSFFCVVAGRDCDVNVNVVAHLTAYLFKRFEK